jgi:hypothetical protein
MRTLILTSVLTAALTAILTAVLTAAWPAAALADNYPVNGRFGVVSAFSDKPVDCAGKRVIAFNGNQRTDSRGGVPAYRNRTVTAAGTATWRVVDIITTGQIANANAVYTLHARDGDRLEMNQQPGGALKLQRCQ